MISRRSFLVSLNAITLASTLSGCSSNAAMARVVLLKGSIPTQLLNEFLSTLARKNPLNFQAKTQLQDLFKLLETLHDRQKADRTEASRILWNRSTPKLPNVDLVTIGNYWLTEAIKEKLIEPLKIEKVRGWQNLPPSCQKLVRRNDRGELEEKGEIWAAPYRWGTTIIAYRRDKLKNFGWTPADWSDLWREELRDRISLLNHPREVIGLTLKKLGYSYNTTDLNKVSNLESEIISLQKQVKFYSSTEYLQPLILGNTWLAVGWSSDILPLLAANPNIKAIIPSSGTALWADLWAKPAVKDTSPDTDIIQEWINFCWQPKPASEISLLTNAASPVVSTINPAELLKDIRDNPLVRLNSSILDKSEFIEPLSKSSQQQYYALWEKIYKIRTSRSN
ncbi:MAG: extracellular solute-binding protein [Prochloraceae cyanobacterium]|nr:extracellular solute-binding protein [Prochloraceae cyanobacterium]